MEQDPDFIALSRQFRATAMELVSVLEQVMLVNIDHLTFILFTFYSIYYYHHLKNRSFNELVNQYSTSALFFLLWELLPL